MIHVDETDPVGEIEPAFPYRDVAVRRETNFTNNYDVELELGRGKFGTVYLCKDKNSDLRLAAKVVNVMKKEDRRSVEREVEIMRRLQHPRLIQLYDAVDTGKQFYVVLELIEGGELFERVIDDDFVLTERSCAVFMRQICEGIEFVHSQNILHLDLKPENILCLTKEGNRIKIIDFGLARLYDPKKKLQVLFGTPEFVAPEVVNFDEIGFGTDMWSIGVICYVLISGLSPFMGDTDIETMANVTIAKYDFDHEAFANISDEAKDFISSLLVKDKKKRKMASQVLSHPWLARKIIQSAQPASIEASTNKNRLNEQTQDYEVSSSSKKTDKSNSKTKSLFDEKLFSTSKSSILKSKDELDVTKDNLKVFVERWRDHPNSPYLMENNSTDLESLATARSSHQVNGSMSLRGQSPSPPESICSVTSEISESSLPLFDNNNHVENNKSSYLDIVHLSCLDRRASEGYFARSDLSHHQQHQQQQYQYYPAPRDPLSQIMLAEEIIKLSEHLRSTICVKSDDEISDASKIDLNKNNPKSTVLPTIMQTASVINKTSEKIVKIKTSDSNNNNKSNKTKISSSSNNNNNNSNNISNSNISNNSNNNEVNEITEKLKSLTRDRKLNGTKFNGNKNYNEMSSDSSTSIKNVLKKTSITITETDNTSNTSEMTRDVDLTPPWRRLRAKHRFGETCRDVPRINNLQNIHKDISLDEQATSAKDLLLQLLNEWEEKPAFKLGARSKSISVDRSNEESIARQSINTLAEYFQSVQSYNKQTCSTKDD